MRANALVLLLVILGLVQPGAASEVSAEAGVSVTPTLESREPIRIEGDAEFVPGSGIRGGDGSAEDPFVISRWHLLPTDSPGILLNHTRAHVIIEDILVGYQAGVAARIARCNPMGRICIDVGVYLNDAQNVTIRRLVVPVAIYGVGSIAGRNITIVDSSFGKSNPSVPGLGNQLTGSVHGAFSLSDNHDVFIRNITLTNSLGVFVVGRGSNVTVADSNFSAGSLATATFNGPIDHLQFIGNRFSAISLRFGVQSSTNVSIVDNEFSGPVPIDGFTGLRDSLICGNLLRGSTNSFTGAITLEEAIRVTIRENRIVSNQLGITLRSGEGNMILHNLVRDASGTSSSTAKPVRIATSAVMRGNSFVNITGEVALVRTIDARDNWWGSADGPSGAGPGNGTELLLGSQPVEFTPWLTEAPPEPGPCSMGPNARPGPQPTMDLQMTVHAKVHANAHGGPLDEDHAVERHDAREIRAPFP